MLGNGQGAEICGVHLLRKSWQLHLVWCPCRVYFLLIVNEKWRDSRSVPGHLVSIRWSVRTKWKHSKGQFSKRAAKAFLLLHELFCLFVTWIVKSTLSDSTWLRKACEKQYTFIILHGNQAKRALYISYKILCLVRFSGRAQLHKSTNTCIFCFCFLFLFFSF